MTREEKERVVDALLRHYENLGATLVSDDHTLCRLLRMLELTEADRDLSEYLCSFLIN